MSERKIITSGHDAVTRKARPDYPYGSPPTLRVANGDSRAFMQFALGALPKKVSITQALLEVSARQASSPTPTEPLILRKCFDGWDSETITWNREPTLGADPVDSKLLTGPAGSSVRFDVTQNIIGAYTGATKNRGWRLSTNSNSPYYLGGFDGGATRPRLIVDYDYPTEKATIDRPANGEVGRAKPVLVIDAMPDTKALRAQVSLTKDFANVAWESQWIPIDDAPIIDLSKTSFPGLNTGVLVWVRADAKNDRGPGGWGPPVWLKLYPNLDLSWVAPQAGPVEDGSPPMVWQVGPGQTQERYRARILRTAADTNGDGGGSGGGGGGGGSSAEWPLEVYQTSSGDSVLWDSGDQVTPVTAATPAKGLTKVGQSATLEVTAQDDRDRVASPGDPVAVTIRRRITLAGSAEMSVMAGLQVEQAGYGEPWIRITGERGSIPDYLSVVRDGSEVKRILGGAAYDPDNPTLYSAIDYTAPAQLRHSWMLEPIVNGKRPAAGSSQELWLTPDIKGVWLCDPTTGDDVVLTGRDDPGVEPYVDAETIYPLGAEFAVVRTFSIGKPIFTLTGMLTGWLRDAETSKRLLESWLRRSVRRGLVLRAAWSSINVPVTVSGVTVTPVRGLSRPNSPRYAVTITAPQAPEPDTMVDPGGTGG